MQKELSNKEMFLKLTERIGINTQYYLDTNDRNFLDNTISYVKSAYNMIKEMVDENS